MQAFIFVCPPKKVTRKDLGSRFGVAVIQEAGGVVTDVYGKSLTFLRGEPSLTILVSSFPIQFHDEVLVAVREVLGL